MEILYSAWLNIGGESLTSFTVIKAIAEVTASDESTGADPITSCA